MRNDHEKAAVITRLRKIQGQVGGLQRMLDADAYCIDVLTQIAAVQGALGQVGRTILSQHIATCVREAFESGDQAQHERMIAELMDVFGRYARLGNPKGR
ncbi:MAG: metal-sensitive transcriptional regulator [Planctomycetes bacterium]|nr:metal-sensitive transcriptional regulator [Planctomycetota bacterium]